MLKKFTDHLLAQIAILITAAVFIFVLFIIVSKFFFDLSYNCMGQIGSAFGGFMGPVVSAISIYYVYQNLKLDRESIERIDINQQITSHEKYFDSGVKDDIKMLDYFQIKIDEVISYNANSNLLYGYLLDFKILQDLIIITSRINSALLDGRVFYEKRPSFLINISYKIYELGIDEKLYKLEGALNTEVKLPILIEPNVLTYFTQMLSSIRKNIYTAPS